MVKPPGGNVYRIGQPSPPAPAPGWDQGPVELEPLIGDGMLSVGCSVRRNGYGDDPVDVVVEWLEPPPLVNLLAVVLAMSKPGQSTREAYSSAGVRRVYRRRIKQLRDLLDGTDPARQPARWQALNEAVAVLVGASPPSWAWPAEDSEPSQPAESDAPVVFRTPWPEPDPAKVSWIQDANGHRWYRVTVPAGGQPALWFEDGTGASRFWDQLITAFGPLTKIDRPSSPQRGQHAGG